jgi:hypothetical protein
MTSYVGFDFTVDFGESVSWPCIPDAKYLYPTDRGDGLNQWWEARATLPLDPGTTALVSTDTGKSTSPRPASDAVVDDLMVPTLAAMRAAGFAAIVHQPSIERDRFINDTNGGLYDPSDYLFASDDLVHPVTSVPLQALYIINDVYVPENIHTSVHWGFAANQCIGGRPSSVNIIHTYGYLLASILPADIRYIFIEDCTVGVEPGTAPGSPMQEAAADEFRRMIRVAGEPRSFSVTSLQMRIALTP